MTKSPSTKFALSTSDIAGVTVISPIFWIMHLGRGSYPLLIEIFIDGLRSPELQLKLLRESPRTLMDAVKIALAENDVLKRWELRKGRASSETHYECNRPNRRIVVIYSYHGLPYDKSVLVSLMIKSPSIKFVLSTCGITRVTVIFWVKPQHFNGTC
jgi:hypothetical protein